MSKRINTQACGAPTLAAPLHLRCGMIVPVYMRTATLTALQYGDVGGNAT